LRSGYFIEWRLNQQRRRNSFVNPAKPVDPITITLAAEEGRQLFYMAECWLDELSPNKSSGDP